MASLKATRTYSKPLFDRRIRTDFSTMPKKEYTTVHHCLDNNTWETLPSMYILCCPQVFQKKIKIEVTVLEARKPYSETVLEARKPYSETSFALLLLLSYFSSFPTFLLLLPSPFLLLLLCLYFPTPNPFFFLSLFSSSFFVVFCFFFFSSSSCVFSFCCFLPPSARFWSSKSRP